MSETKEKKEEEKIEGLEDIVNFFLWDSRATVLALADLPREVVHIAKVLFDEEKTIDRRDFYVEANKVQLLNDLIVELVKTNKDHDFFLWRGTVKEYLEIMSKLATIWTIYDKTDRPEVNVKVDRLLELVKAVESDLWSLVLRIVDHVYHCDDPDEEEEEL